MPPTANEHLTRRATFRHWARDKLRYNDTDKLGHVNNAVYATFFETARIELLHLQTAEPWEPPGASWVIARLAIDFRRELNWPGEVEIGSVVTRVGNSSFELAQGAFKGDLCVATAETVEVLMDLTTRRASPMPDWLKANLNGLLASG